jgi:hypothetical protein
VSTRAHPRHHPPNASSPDSETEKKRSTAVREVASPESEGHSVPRVCTLEGFAEELAKRGGVDPSLLDPLSQISVTTEHTTYRITLIDPATSQVLVQDAKFFPLPLEAVLCGASFGGSFLKQQWIGIGMRMELNCGRGNIVTAPVVSVEIEEETEIAGPF